MIKSAVVGDFMGPILGVGVKSIETRVCKINDLGNFFVRKDGTLVIRIFFRDGCYFGFKGGNIDFGCIFGGNNFDGMEVG